MIDYGFKKELSCSVAELERVVTAELKKEGFGVLTRIDVKDKFREKLDIEFKDYVILGACNPPYAHKSILAEEDIGLMLPCNVIIYSSGEGSSVLSIIKPAAAMGVIGNEKLADIANTVEQKLKAVFDNIKISN